jgi:hypothetical protein
MCHRLCSFAFQNTKDREGYAQNKIFGILIQEAWFSNSSKSKGIVFEKYFNPISLETLALLFTMVCSCLFVICGAKSFVGQVLH